MEIELSDKVYEPAEDTELAINALAMLLERSSGGLAVLDMGCGTGIIGIFAAKSAKVDSVTLADIYDEAVELARKNVRLAGLEKAKVVKSDLFNNINGLFDIIVFNAPYLKSEESEKPEDAVMLSGGKEGVEVSIRFLEDARPHLKKFAHVIITSSSFSNQKLLRSAYSDLGYIPEFSLAKHIFFEDIVADVLKYTGPL